MPGVIPEKGVTGILGPPFQRPKYIVQKGEWEDAVSQNERTRGSYHQEDFVPLRESGQLELIDGNQAIEEGIELIKIPGHNRHFQTVIIQSNGKKAVYLGDLIPTVTHLAFPYIMGFDLFPLETLEAKKWIIRQAAEEGWLLIFEHDPETRMGYVRMEEGKPVLKEVVEG
jgi:glyoxylase-like metal-dependent hydrolase (beta-lactamase superfamily II)